MSDAIRTNLLHRLWNTPLRDALRGRLNSRLDWRARLAAVGLPTAARERIERLVKRTRLWRVEKASLADELAAHFRDALAGGESVNSILAEFGNERDAAKLIRRAKIRNRPLLWRAWRWSLRAITAIVVAYATLLLPFFLSRPTPTVDYRVVMNEPVLSAAPAELGWPLYRRAIIGMLRTPTGDPNEPYKHAHLRWPGENVDGPTWPQAAAWLAKHAADLELLRQATGKPMMGFVLSPEHMTSDSEVYPVSPLPSNPRPIDPSALIATLLPYLNDSRALAGILMADAKAAQLDRDGLRVESDVRAMLDLARQLRRKPGFLVAYLVAVGVDSLAMQTLQRALLTDPTLLSDGQLIALAHQIAQPKSDADFVDYGGEQMAFADIMQRIYTNDGHGDGHITADGLHFYQLVRDPFGDQREFDRRRMLTDVSGPMILLTSASRKEELATMKRFLGQAQSDLHLPAREVDFGVFDRLAGDQSGSLRNRLRFDIVSEFVPAIAVVQIQAERDLGQRDGMMTAIALELYRRQNGEYPQQLIELTPIFLPAVTADQITGQPIKYKLVNGKPLLYSVGADRIDDGGKPPMENGRPRPLAAATWGTALGKTPERGDWILYPVPPFMD